MNPLEKSEFCLRFWRSICIPVAKLVQGQPHPSAEPYVRLETGLIHGGVSGSLWRKLTTTGSMDEQTCGWVEVKARWTCSTYQVAMQRWIGIEKSPDSTLVVFSRFYSSSLEVEMDLHPVDFRVSELVPFLHCSRVPLSWETQGGHFEAARKELMKMLKVGQNDTWILWCSKLKICG